MGGLLWINHSFCQAEVKSEISESFPLGQQAHQYDQYKGKGFGYTQQNWDTKVNHPKCLLGGDGLF